MVKGLFVAVALIFMVRSTYVVILIWRRVRERRPEDPRLEFIFLRNNLGYLLELDQDLYPERAAYWQRQEVKAGTFVAFALFAIYVVLSILRLV